MSGTGAIRSLRRAIVDVPLRPRLTTLDERQIRLELLDRRDALDRDRALHDGAARQDRQRELLGRGID